MTFVLTPNLYTQFRVCLRPNFEMGRCNTLSIVCLAMVCRKLCSFMKKGLTGIIISLVFHYAEFSTVWKLS
jgi:hypothetical protein